MEWGRERDRQTDWETQKTKKTERGNKTRSQEMEGRNKAAI